MKQREIKYRAWYKPKGNMYWFDVMDGMKHGIGGGYIPMCPWEETITRHQHKDNLIPVDPMDCELMQFTGLHDKNGKEIYEGDIVNYATKKRWCKNKNCEGQHELGITNFCPKCGTKTELIDFLTTAKVVYEKAAFAYRNEVDEHHYISWDCYANEKFIEWVEIIGNIYENPELLTPPVQGRK